MVSRSHLGVLSQARGGNAQAQFELGRLYLSGAAGLPKNQVVALDWLRRAATQGVHEAGELLAHHIPAELAMSSTLFPELIRWYRRSALAGSRTAQWAYVTMHERHAARIEAEHPRARELTMSMLQTLADEGRVDAQWLLSQWHQRDGNQEAAIRAAHAAAERGHHGALMWMARHRHISKNEGSDSLFVSCVQQLLERNDALDGDARAILFDFYVQHGYDHAMARAALERAAELGHAPAAWELGRLHLDATRLDGRNKVAAQDQIALARLLASNATQRPPASLRQAVAWLTRATANADAADADLAVAGNAAYVLGLLYRIPAFSRRDLATSDQWMRTAAEHGQRDAQHWLGLHLWRHRAHEANAMAEVEAVDWLMRAAQAGHTPSEVFLRQYAARAEERPDWAVGHIDTRALAAIAQRHPLMARRIELGKLLGLRRIELLLIDWNTAVHEHSVVVDLSAWTPKHARRVIALVDAPVRNAVREAVFTFREHDAGEAGPEGNHRQRVYLFRQMMEIAATLQATGNSVLPGTDARVDPRAAANDGTGPYPDRYRASRALATA